MRRKQAPRHECPTRPRAGDLLVLAQRIVRALAASRVDRYAALVAAGDGAEDAAETMALRTTRERVGVIRARDGAARWLDGAAERRPAVTLVRGVVGAQQLRPAGRSTRSRFTWGGGAREGARQRGEGGGLGRVRSAGSGRGRVLRPLPPPAGGSTAAASA